nr:hypothetical protein [Russula virescens]
MINLLNYNLLIYVILTCTAFLLSYFLYNLIKNKSFSNNKGLIFRNIAKLSFIPSSQSNGTVSTYTIHQLKYQEIVTNYPRELAEFRVTNAEVWDTISSFSANALQANDINHIILTILSYIHP